MKGNLNLIEISIILIFLSGCKESSQDIKTDAYVHSMTTDSNIAIINDFENINELAQEFADQQLDEMQESEDYDSLIVLPNNKTYHDLEKSIDLRDLSYFPPVINQGSINNNACNSFATVYYLKTFQEAKENRVDIVKLSANQDSKDYKENVFDGEYFFKWMTRKSDVTNVASVLAKMIDYGAWTISDVEMMKSKDGKNPEFFNLDHRVEMYFRVYDREYYEDHGLDRKNSESLLKKFLAEGFPLVVILDYPKKIHEKGITDQVKWKNRYSGNHAKHACLIIGYDKKYFRILNSYGRKWGKADEGTFLIHRDRLLEYGNSIYAVVDHKIVNIEDYLGEIYMYGKAKEISSPMLPISAGPLSLKEPLKNLSIKERLSREPIQITIVDQPVEYFKKTKTLYSMVREYPTLKKDMNKGGSIEAICFSLDLDGALDIWGKMKEPSDSLSVLLNLKNSDGEVLRFPLSFGLENGLKTKFKLTRQLPIEMLGLISDYELEAVESTGEYENQDLDLEYSINQLIKKLGITKDEYCEFIYAISTEN